jgi:hypothetical protein
MSDDLLMTREHRIYASRKEQLRNNLAAIAGGRPYIDLRLHRAPNESDISWNGSNDKNIPSRKGRAYLLNDAGRIAGKFNQYLFANPATRDGIDASFAQDCTTTGMTIGQFWQHVSDLFTGGQWAWLHYDRGAPEIDNETGRPRMRTLAQREAANDRIYWSVYSSSDVVDWSFDQSGRLVWLLTSESVYENPDPFSESISKTVRMLWRRGNGGAGATWERWEQIEEKVSSTAAGSISAPDVPFISLGMPSESPWWFDDVELIQCALLNLSSLHHENLVKTVYPQLIIPQVMAETLEGKLIERYGQANATRVTEIIRELIRGLDRPFIEDKEHSGITRYLQPNAQDLKAIPEEEDRRRKALFDVVGLALFNRETRQVQSAESKQFDHLDTEATLRNRALIMQDAEAKLVAMSAALDTSFKQYVPVWPQDFDVPNTADDVAALVQIGNFVEPTPTMRKILNRAAVKLVDSIDRIPPEDRAAVMDEIDQISEEAPPEPAPTPSPPRQ